MTNGKKCQFTAEYYDYESPKWIPYNCPDDEEIPGSGLCMFHDERYLQDEDNNKEQSVRDGLDAKIRQNVDQKEPLFCMGYHLRVL